MNKERRKRLKEAANAIESARAIIEEVCEEESDALENLPENMQDGERAEAMQEYIDAMDDAKDSLDDIISSLEEIFEG